LANFDAGKTADYTLKNSANGVYVFVIGGDATINGVELNERDGLGITETDQLNIVANTHTEILLIEVPMNVNVE
jgi:redox-sensitive bicupin YhaK (pirin superfamily)